MPSFQRRRLYGKGKLPHRRLRRKLAAMRPSLQSGGLTELFGKPLAALWQGIRRLPGFVVRSVQQLPRDRNGWKTMALRLVVVGAGVGILYLVFLWVTLPNIDDPRSLLASQSTVILDRNGIELYRLHGEEDRTFVEGESIAEHMKEAIVAIEDERYFTRGCLDVRALARAVFRLGNAGGASTLTRQLARNAMDLRQDNLLNRKLKELILGCQLESKFSKDELLLLYLNWIPFGQNAYGIEQASQKYFGKSASGLTLAESAVLASLPKGPSYFNPYGRHLHTTVSDTTEAAVLAGRITEASEIDDEVVSVGLLGATIGTGSTTVYIGGRTDQVLQNMEDQGYIDEAERLAALDDLEEIVFQPSRENIRAPHFVLWVRDQIEEMFAGTAEEGILEQGGLRVETTLDWELQQSAEDAVSFHREDILNRYGAQNIALLSATADTREIVAYVGNMDYDDTEHGGKIDMVHAPRQPGSSFKPFVFAAAFQRGYSPATVLYDVPTKIGDNEPQNFDGKFMGPMTIRNALGASRNIPAAKAFFLGGGEDNILALVSNMGAPSPHQRRQELAAERAEGFDYGWPLALGAAETPLFEMVQAYSTFANHGTYQPLISIRRITDKYGNLLYEADVEEEDVMDPRIAYQVTSVLSDESARPEEYWRTQLTVPGYQTAAKTGTSNKCLERNETTGDCRLLKPDNAWLLGYTPELVTGVWAGNADSSAMFDKAGGLNTSSPIWRDFMVRAHRRIDSPTTTFDEPDGIVRPQISQLSGQLPTECTPVNLRRSDVFLRENAPSLPDPACRQLIIDKVTKLLASDTCPVEAQESGSFLVAHSILPDRWPTWEEGVQNWVDEQMALWYATPNHSGSILPLPVAPTEKCDPSLTPGRLDKPELSILFPVANGVATYPSFVPQLRFEVGSSIQEVIYELDGKRVARETAEPFERPVRVPRSLEKAGRHTLTVTVVDEYFNQASDSVTFSFEEDRSPPSVRLLTPRDGATLKSGAKVTMRADASDRNGAIKYVQFYLDDVLLSTKPSEPYELEYELTDLADGMHTIRVIAEDMAENTTADDIRIFIGAGGSEEVVETDPLILAPSGDLGTVQQDELIELRINTPRLDAADIENLRLGVFNAETDEEELLLDIDEGFGTYVRTWKAATPGTYSIVLYTKDRSGQRTVWDERSGVTVQ